MAPPRADAVRNRARILAAADEVFAARGPAATTEEVAARAGVAVGTVFRHFPTKQDLLRAIVKDLLAGLIAQAEGLLNEDEPGQALFTFFVAVVERAARQQTVVGLLDGELDVSQSMNALAEPVAALLAGAQEAGTARPGVCADEIVALLVVACQGALRWSDNLRLRTVARLLAGIRT